MVFDDIYAPRGGRAQSFQVMPGAQWLELLCRHIQDRYEHLVRYVGWYSNRAHGERAKRATQPGSTTNSTGLVEPTSDFAAKAKAAWARLIRKVYEADPLECPRCHGPMRVIALIEDRGVVKRILQHLGLWVEDVRETQGSPPGYEDWPEHANFSLTYHPIPEIA